MPKDGLTDQQQLFISEYLKDYNATEAAKRAGYAENSAHVQGCRLLKHDNIRNVIREHLDDALNATKMALKNEVLERLYEIAVSDPDIQTDKEGNIIGATRRDSLKALELLGKHMAMFTDRVEHSGDPDRPVLVSLSDILNADSSQPGQ